MEERIVFGMCSSCSTDCGRLILVVLRSYKTLERPIMASVDGHYTFRTYRWPGSVVLATRRTIAFVWLFAGERHTGRKSDRVWCTYLHTQFEMIGKCQFDFRGAEYCITVLCSWSCLVQLFSQVISA